MLSLLRVNKVVLVEHKIWTRATQRRQEGNMLSCYLKGEEKIDPQNIRKDPKTSLYGTWKSTV